MSEADLKRCADKAGLEPAVYQALRLRSVEGREDEEIARELHIGLSSVRSYCSVGWAAVLKAQAAFEREQAAANADFHPAGVLDEPEPPAAAGEPSLYAQSRREFGRDLLAAHKGPPFSHPPTPAFCRDRYGKYRPAVLRSPVVSVDDVEDGYRSTWRDPNG